MSSLGIKFVLPYKGNNGIKVNNNVISIDSNEEDILVKSLLIKSRIWVNYNRLSSQPITINAIANEVAIIVNDANNLDSFKLNENGSIRTGTGSPTLQFTEFVNNPAGYITTNVNNTTEVNIALLP
jgi:hypothetical protein